MQTDPRIRVTLTHLRSLQGAARQIAFLPRQPAHSVLNGQHASRLRGRGLNFEEMRDYLPGDDVRAIDWKATARTGSPHVRVYTEERDRPALLVVDQCMSMFFGSVLNMKSVTAAEAAAIAAFRILRAGDRVGGIVFNDEQQVDFAPRRSQGAVFAMLRTLADMNAALGADNLPTPRNSLNGVLKSVTRLARHDHLVLIFSDFAGIDDTTFERVSTIAAHNDVILMLVYDPIAETLAPSERVVVGDGRLQADIDFASQRIVDVIGGYSRERLQRIRDWQQKATLSVLPLSAGEETLPQIRRLMGLGANRVRRP